MKSNHADIAAAWIVALALIAAMAVDAFLPQTPPRLGHGVTPFAGLRAGTNLSASPNGMPDTELPLLEFGDPFGPQPGDMGMAAPRSPGSDLSPQRPGPARG